MADASQSESNQSEIGREPRHSVRNPLLQPGPKRTLGSEIPLLIDDDVDIIESMRPLCRPRGMKSSSPGMEIRGWRWPSGRRPALVILDMMMPKRSGFLVLERLRRTQKDPTPRQIMITANEGSRHKAYAEMLGVDDHIPKPFAMDRLIESVERLLA